MKLQCISDLHSEFFSDCPDRLPLECKKIIEAGRKEGTDCLLIAGDFGAPFLHLPRTGWNNVPITDFWTHEQLFLEGLRELSKGPYDQIFLVPGNHEYYGSNLHKVDEWLHSLKEGEFGDKLSILQGNSVQYKGVHILGATLWFGGRPDNQFYWKGMSDSLFNGTSLAEIEELGKETAQWIGERMRFIAEHHPSEPVIVVTHMAPTIRSVPRQFRGSKLNRFYINDLVLPKIEQQQRHLPLLKMSDIWLHGHCIDKETEILTTNGWKNHKNIKQGDFSYSYDKNTGLLVEDKIQQLVCMESYSGKVFELHGKSFSMNVTDLHTVVGLSPKTKEFIAKPAKEILKKTIPLDLIIAGVCASSCTGTGLDPLLLKLYISIAADGNITPSNLVRFDLTKQRKVKYLLDLLHSLKISYKYFPQPDRGDRVHFKLPKELQDWQIKGLDKRILNSTIEECRIILEGYRNTDGNKNRNQVAIYTSKEEEKDILQHMFVIHGFKTTVTTRIGHGFSTKPSYTLYVKEQQTAQWQKLSNRPIEKEVQNEFYWCITNSNHNFLMRRRGRVCLTGNTHSSFDYIQQGTGMRIVCNPFGYYGTADWNQNFDYGKVIEIGE